MIKKVVSLLLIVLIITFGIINKDELIHIINEGGTISIIVGMALVATTVFFPVVPFAILAGVIGGVFGAVHGIFISLTGAMFGTMLLFFLSRYGFKDWAQKKVKQYPKLQEYESFLERNSFMTVLFVRLVPVIPSPVVNIVGGLSKVKWFIFFIASTIGKIPNITVVSLAGAKFTENKLFSFGLYGVYMIIILLINYWYIQRKMKNNQKPA